MRRRVEAGREFQDAVGEGARRQIRQLLVWVWSSDGKSGEGTESANPSRKYLARCLRLQSYLLSPGDGRTAPQIPARVLLWALLLGRLLREYSFYAVEALVHSSARRALQITTSFGDDVLGYFTERLPAAPTRAALATALCCDAVSSKSIWPHIPGFASSSFHRA